MGGELVVAGRRPRVLSPLREHLRDTFWFAPLAGLVVAGVLSVVCVALDRAWVGVLRGEGDFAGVEGMIRFAARARPVVNTIGSAVLTLTGVVFSISLVALQMASGQWSQRVVRLYVRDRIAKGTFAVFLATFAFTLLAQLRYGGVVRARTAQAVPYVTSVVALVLVGLSLVLFVAYVNSTMTLLRISHVVDLISRQARRLLVMPTRPHGMREEPGRLLATVAYAGRAGVLRDVHVARVCRVARRQGVVVHLLPRIGDFLVPGTPVIAVHQRDGDRGAGRGADPGPGSGPGPDAGREVSRWVARVLNSTLSTGVERTFHQDLGFGLRQLVDIALRALSPAVNDPTTAVQCLDRVQQFLSEAAGRPLGLLAHTDRGGAVRMVQDLPGWRDLVRLGFSEIRAVAPGNAQVTRRLRAALEDLEELAPEERKDAVREQLSLLAEAMEREVPDPKVREFALTADRQGIG